jgi:hypothetical protein
VAKLFHGPGVAVGDQTLLRQGELLLGGFQGALHLLARGLQLIPTDLDLAEGHGRANARSGQDQNGGQALQ